MNFWLSLVVGTSVGRRKIGRVSPTGVQGNPSTQKLPPDSPGCISGKPERPQKNGLLGKVVPTAQGGKLEVPEE